MASPHAGALATAAVVTAAAAGFAAAFAAGESLRVSVDVGLAAGAGALAVCVAWRLWRSVVERTQLEETLEEVESRYRALVAGLPLVTYRRAVEQPREWLFVSPNIEELLGYSAEEWTGHHDLFARLLQDSDRERVLASDRGHGPHRDEYGISSRDGRLIWVRDEWATVRDENGVPLYVQGFLVDMSERKTLDADHERILAAERAAVTRANEKQKQIDLLAEVSEILTSQADYGRAIRNVADLMTRQLADWCVAGVLNEEGELETLAMTHSEPVGTRELREVEKGLVNERVAYRVAETRKAEVGGSYLCVPLVVRDRALGALTLISTGSGREYRREDLALAADVGCRIAAAIDNGRLYREVEARADAARVLTYVGDGVFLVDRSGVIRLWNPAAETIAGLAATAVVGRVAGDVLPWWNRLIEWIPISESPESTTPKTIPLETSNGERWISISGVDFFGGTVYAFRDCTEERRLDELKADFVATASHELRTPLAAVYGAAQTLRRHDFALDEAGRERFVSLIAEEAERLSRIVNEILLANQLEVGRLDVTVEPFDPLDLVGRVAESARAHLPSDLNIEIVPPRSNAPIAVDRDKVRQVLVNLVENAIKYSPDGGTIQIGVALGDAKVRFWVKDNGLGVPPEEQARIFDKFYRLDPGMTRGVGGTGLGLYICSELVSRMDGEISVESTLGGGSVFSFELPSGEAVFSRASSGETTIVASE